VVFHGLPPEQAGQTDFGFPAIAIGVEVDLLIGNGAPESFHQDVVVAAPSA
jgi:hypothetical protein